MLSAAGLAVAMLGFRDVHVGTFGLHRNAIGALWPRPKIAMADSSPSFSDRRASPFGKSMEDFTALRGAAAGRNIIMVVLNPLAHSICDRTVQLKIPLNLTIHQRSIQFDKHSVYRESIKGCSHVVLALSIVSGGRVPGIPVPAFPGNWHAGYKSALFHSGRFVYLGMEGAIEHQGFV
jgi:hypothetical protein